MKDIDRVNLAYKIINHFDPKGISDRQKQVIMERIGTCDDDTLKMWIDVATKISNHDIKIKSSINQARSRRFTKIKNWKKKVYANRGITLSYDGLTPSLEDFLTKELEKYFND